MIFITNRCLLNKSGLSRFGKQPNPQGPNEIRMVEVRPHGKSWVTKELPDTLTTAEVKALNKTHKLGLPTGPNISYPMSLKVACNLHAQARESGKSILFFVHGFNNDVKDVVLAAEAIESLYDVIVVPITWPANGGGALTGLASYKSDKSDARSSAGALNRIVGKIQDLHKLLTEAEKAKLQEKASSKHPDDGMKRDELFTRLLEKACPVKINLLCHSMGNYVLKHTFATSQATTAELTFDNICLVAADTNAHDHIRWVSRIDVRNRLYVVINEADSALKASRIKPGDEQKARLGHYTRGLSSPNAHYLDLTGAPSMGSEHTYFKGDVPANNTDVKDLFQRLFTGGIAERSMVYQPDNNSYRF